MDTIAYHQYYERERKARELYNTLKEMYGDSMKKETILIKARIDGVINDDEKRLLREFYS